MDGLSTTKNTLGGLFKVIVCLLERSERVLKVCYLNIYSLKTHLFHRKLKCIYINALYLPGTYCNSILFIAFG